MVELSVTVTVGSGSETHNHDLEYRATLKHVHGKPDGVIELIPYVPYQEQINEAVRPYIKKYNEEVDRRYQAAWDRYNSGQIKTKPRKRDYKHVDYDYYTEHLHDEYYNKKLDTYVNLPMWRSMIIGIGDREDRQAGRLTEGQARRIMTDAVQEIIKKFPHLLILGATLHLDEEGFYHIHLDYKPFFEKDIGQGLGFCIGQESALEAMGFRPEQSIINARDKAPLLFNAMRNKIYRIIEREMAEEGLRLQYGVSKTKDPEKDSSKNQRLEDWKDVQDSKRELQHQKNIILDAIEKDEVLPEDIEEATSSVQKITDVLRRIMLYPRYRAAKNNVVVEYRLLDQLKSFTEDLSVYMGVIYAELHRLRGKYMDLSETTKNSIILSEIEYNLMVSKHRSQLIDANQKIGRLEKFLADRGMHREAIREIEEHYRYDEQQK